jgi:shikimate kinase
MMGSGKTSVGSAVAGQLDRPFIDLDHEIEARQGRSIGDIFGLESEEAFRGYESAMLAEVLAVTTPSVICTGGGAVLDPANRSLMRERGTVVWLQADPVVLARRLGSGAGGRPLLRFDGDDDGEGPALAERIARLVNQRRPAYEEVAHETVFVDDLDIESAADAVSGLASREAR